MKETIEIISSKPNISCSLTVLCYLNFFIFVSVYDLSCSLSIHFLNGQKITTCTFNPVSNLFFACIMIVSPHFQKLEKAQCLLASHQKSLLNEGLLMRDPGLVNIEHHLIFYCVWVMTSVIVKRLVCRWTWFTAPITEKNSRLRFISFQVSNN